MKPCVLMYNVLSVRGAQTPWLITLPSTLSDSLVDTFAKELKKSLYSLAGFVFIILLIPHTLMLEQLLADLRFSN